jgi:hypothetical protein
MQVIGNEAVPPRLLNPKIENDLETICMKCLEKNASLRYTSAEELGDDLQRYLDGESIHARSFNVFDRLAHVLERDTHTADFSAWSSMIFGLAAIVGTEHFLVFGLILAGVPPMWVNLARFLQFAALGALFWYNRGSRLLPTTAAERELWTIWIGYFTTYFFVVIVMRLLHRGGILTSDPAWEESAYFLELLPYPFISLLSGLSFFIIGANYWGR